MTHQLASFPRKRESSQDKKQKTFFLISGAGVPARLNKKGQKSFFFKWRAGTPAPLKEHRKRIQKKVCCFLFQLDSRFRGNDGGGAESFYLPDY